MRRFLLLALIITLAFGSIYGLVSFMGVQGFGFAWVLNFMLMMFVLMFTEILKPKFTSPYYKQQDFELRGKIYEKLGINVFRKLLVVVGWEKLNKKANNLAVIWQMCLDGARAVKGFERDDHS